MTTITEAAKRFLATAETWRTDELDVKRRILADLEQQLGAAQEKTRTLPVTIGNLRATIARLEAQTAADIAREALATKGGDANATRDARGVRDGESTSSHARSGISPDGLQVTPPSVGHSVPIKRIHDFAWSGLKLKPLGKSWSEVEAMADEAEKPAEPKMLDLRTVRRAAEHADPDWVVADADLFDVGEGSPSIEKGQRFQVERIAADHRGLPRVKVTTREGGYNQHFIAAIQPAHVVTAEPKQPALLDLRELPPGTVCEATGQIARGSHVILPGERFAFAGSPTELLARVRVFGRDESFDVPTMVHASVVKEPKGKGDSDG